MLNAQRVTTQWLPAFALTAMALWFAWLIVPASIVALPPAWIALRVVPLGFLLLFFGTATGVIVSRGKAPLPLIATFFLGMTVALSAVQLLLLGSLADF